MATARTVVSELALTGVVTAGDLRARLRVSPATLMRAVRAGGRDVVRIGRARATRYGLRETWPNLDRSQFPVFRVSAEGTARRDGDLHTLAQRQSVWLPAGLVSTGVPAEIADARPSGFLGRHFAAVHADLHLPARPADWSDHHILMAMSRRGDDLAGHLIVGDESFARWQEAAVVSHTRADYPALAEATLAGNPPGSSAGGERPKFGVFVDGRHALVKFARRGDGAAARWCDLLVLEALALGVVAARGQSAAANQLIETASHVFLETERFDRVGARGRLGVISLAAVHDDAADSWARAAASLRSHGRLSDDDARRLAWLDAFGALIANTDRHQFNVTFFSGDSLRLAPAYDQVAMAYAPSLDGDVPGQPVRLGSATGDTLEVWSEARAAAREFWTRASTDPRVSAGMRAIAGAHAQAGD